MGEQAAHFEISDPADWRTPELPGEWCAFIRAPRRRCPRCGGKRTVTRWKTIYFRPLDAPDSAPLQQGKVPVEVECCRWGIELLDTCETTLLDPCVTTENAGQYEFDAHDVPW